MSLTFVRFEDLSVGMRVGVTGCYSHEACTFATVEKKTTANVKLSDGSTWSKNLRERGGSEWNRRLIVTVADAEERNKERDDENVRRCKIRALKIIADHLERVKPAGLNELLLAAEKYLPEGHHVRTNDDVVRAIAFAKRGR